MIIHSIVIGLFNFDQFVNVILMNMMRHLLKRMNENRIQMIGIKRLLTLIKLACLDPNENVNAHEESFDQLLESMDHHSVSISMDSISCQYLMIWNTTKNHSSNHMPSTMIKSILEILNNLKCDASHELNHDKQKIINVLNQFLILFFTHPTCIKKFSSLHFMIHKMIDKVHHAPKPIDKNKIMNDFMNAISEFTNDPIAWSQLDDFITPLMNCKPDPMKSWYHAVIMYIHLNKCRKVESGESLFHRVVSALLNHDKNAINHGGKIYFAHLISNQCKLPTFSGLIKEVIECFESLLSIPDDNNNVMMNNSNSSNSNGGGGGNYQSTSNTQKWYLICYIAIELSRSDFKIANIIISTLCNHMRFLTIKASCTPLIPMGTFKSNNNGMQNLQSRLQVLLVLLRKTLLSSCLLVHSNKSSSCTLIPSDSNFSNKSVLEILVTTLLHLLDDRIVTCTLQVQQPKCFEMICESLLELQKSDTVEHKKIGIMINEHMDKKLSTMLNKKNVEHLPKLNGMASPIHHGGVGNQNSNFESNWNLISDHVAVCETCGYTHGQMTPHLFKGKVHKRAELMYDSNHQHASSNGGMNVVVGHKRRREDEFDTKEHKRHKNE
ncbi:hypothetical protein AKO1_012225 [Acrasis kona]|uniref:Uncharacterized protein n=1 Tax=Acrasis kona TaxID=1008807 RepID=A0AAW2ZBA7_9EUKA